jgi:hypothetical protein
MPDNTGAETSNYARYARSPGEGLNLPPFASNGIAVWKLERISGEVALRGGRPSWVKKRDTQFHGIKVGLARYHCRRKDKVASGNQHRGLL